MIEIGFKFHQYDACVANRMINGRQYTIRFHVDDLMSSHEDHRINVDFYDWLDKKYCRVGKVAQHHGSVHDYLGVYYKYYADMLILDMTDYVKKMVEDFPVKLDRKRSVRTPALENVFNDPKGKL